MLLFVLLAFSAFFSASETSFSSIHKIRFKTMAEEGNDKAKRVLKIVGNYDKFISTVLIGNNIVNIGAATIAAVIFGQLFPAETAAAISTVVMTLLVLTFGEILPKSFAKANADRLVMIFARPIELISIVLSPLVFIFAKMASFVGKSRKSDGKQPTVTEEELKYIIESIEEEGVIGELESELIQSAMDFDDTTVQEIMVPRVDVVALNANDRPEEILKQIVDAGFSRMPVYENNIDNIIGIVHIRDVLIEIAQGRQIDLRKMVNPAKFVYKTMKIEPLLNDFRHSKTHFAIIVDDYGGMSGIVTMEDVLEELVGEIWDESDEIINPIIEIEKDIYEVSGNYNIHDLLEYFEVDEKDFESDYTTAGGWTLGVFERIPEVGESFDYKNLQVTILEVNDQRVVKLIVQKLNPEDIIKNEKNNNGEKRESP
ncbi:hemolysin family protein [Methanolapillus millepedarum]|uniref:hemolysin family protein n=1 Tax=Methanolapillus millepedarum TaxID=3028296 RepID=UPI0030B8F793